MLQPLRANPSDRASTLRLLPVSDLASLGHGQELETVETVRLLRFLVHPRKRHGQFVVIKQFGDLGRRVSGRDRESHHLGEFRLEVFVSSAISRLLFAHVRYRQRPLVSRIANRS
jgi:hypothetical protein